MQCKARPDVRGQLHFVITRVSYTEIIMAQLLSAKEQGTALRYELTNASSHTFTVYKYVTVRLTCITPR